MRADAGVKLERMLALPDTELVTVPDGARGGALARAQRRSRRALRRAGRDVQGRRTAPSPTRSRPSSGRLHNDAERRSRARSTTPTSTRPRRGTCWRARASPSRVVDQAVDATHPDLRRQHRARRQDFLHARRLRRRRRRRAAPTTARTSPGIVAALRDNGIGIAGVAPLAHVLPLRAIDNCGDGNAGVRSSRPSRYAGDEQHPDRDGVVRHRARSTPRPRRLQPGVRRRLRRLSRTRCTSSPPATRAHDDDRAPGLPVRPRAPAHGPGHRRTWSASA